MERLFCGIDLGTRVSSICVIDSNKKGVKRWSGANSEMANIIRGFCPNVHCIVEATPLAESVCKAVEELGGTIEIVDSRHTKALLHGKKKTDRIDAQVLAELAQMGWYRPIHRKDGKCREQRTYLVARAQIVKSATALKNSIYGLLKANGIVLSDSGADRKFSSRVRAAMTGAPQLVREGISKLLICWVQLEREATRMYRQLNKIANKDETAALLMSVPGVGAATAVAFSSTIATHARFSDKKKVASYVGLAPRVYQSGDTNYNGHITKSGDALLRWLLIEAATVMLTRTKQSFALKEWGLRLAEKKGMAKAKVSVARKIAELLFVMWKKNTTFEAA